MSPALLGLLADMNAYLESLGVAGRLLGRGRMTMRLAVGRDGKAIGIGAEGLLAHRTSLPISTIGGQALITDQEVEELCDARREDLPGSPLVWREGLRTLVVQLTDRTPRSR